MSFSKPVSTIRKAPYGKGYHPFDKFDLLKNARLYVLTITKDHLVKGANAFCQFRDCPASKPIESLLHLLLFLISRYPDEYANGGKPIFVHLVERLKHEDKNELSAAGYRILFYVVEEHATNFSAEVEDLIEANNERQENEKYGHKKPQRDLLISKYAFYHLTDKEDLIEWFSTKNGIDYKVASQQIMSDNLCMESNPLHMEKVFGHELGIGMTPYYVDKRQRDWREYVHKGGGNTKFKAPYPDCLYRYTKKQSEITAFLHWELPKPPELTDDSRFKTQAFDVFKKTVLVSSDMKIELGNSERGLKCATEENVKDLYDMTIAHQVESAEPLTALVLNERNKARREAIVEELQKMRNDKRFSKEQIQEHHQMLKEKTFRIGISEFSDVWNHHREAHNSKAVKACIKWGEDYMAKHGGRMYRYLPKATANMSYLTDHLIALAQDLEMVVRASTSHPVIMTLILAAYNAYDPERTQKLHVLMSGNPALAKSFNLDALVKYFFIMNTISNFMYKSLRADAVSGDGDETVEISHEVNYDELGVATGSKPGGRPVYTAAEAQAKAEMTSGMNEGQVFEFEVDENGRKKRTEVTFRKYRNHVRLGATNVPFSEMSPAVRDRYHCVSVPDRRREDRDVIELMGAGSSVGFQKYKQDVIERYRFIHYGVVLINYIIKSGVWEAVDTSYGAQMFTRILKEARTKHNITNTRRPRSFQRLLCADRALVVVRAWLIHRCSSVSIYKDKPFALKDMESIEAQLCDDDPSIVSWVLSMLESEYYNKMQYEAINTIKKKWLTMEDPKRGLHIPDEDDPAARQAFTRVQQAQAKARQEAERLAQSTGLAMDTSSDTDSSSTSTSASASASTSTQTPVFSQKALDNSALENDDQAFEQNKQRCKRLRTKYLKDGNMESVYYHVKEVLTLRSDDESPYSKAHQLANMILKNTEPVPSHSEVYQALYDLMNLKVAIKDEYSLEKKEYTALEFHEDGFYILVDVVENNRSDKMIRSLKEAMEHKYTIPKRIPYGRVSDNEPHKLHCIDLVPRDRPLVLLDLNHFPETALAMAQDRMEDKPENRGLVQTTFSKKRKRTIRQPLEEYFFWKNAENRGWTKAKLVKHHVYPERILQAELLRHAQERVDNWDAKYRELTEAGDKFTESEAEMRLGNKPISINEWNQQYQQLVAEGWSEDRIDIKLGSKPGDDASVREQIVKWQQDKEQLVQVGAPMTKDEAICRLGNRPRQLVDYPFADEDQEEEQLQQRFSEQADAESASSTASASASGKDEKKADAMETDEDDDDQNFSSLGHDPFFTEFVPVPCKPSTVPASNSAPATSVVSAPRTSKKRTLEETDKTAEKEREMMRKRSRQTEVIKPKDKIEQVPPRMQFGWGVDEGELQMPVTD